MTPRPDEGLPPLLFWREMGGCGLRRRDGVTNGEDLYKNSNVLDYSGYWVMLTHFKGLRMNWFLPAVLVLKGVGVKRYLIPQSWFAVYRAMEIYPSDALYGKTTDGFRYIHSHLRLHRIYARFREYSPEHQIPTAFLCQFFEELFVPGFLLLLQKERAMGFASEVDLGFEVASAK